MSSKDPRDELLYKIHENIVRADEKIKALVESTNKESADLRKQIESILKEMKGIKEDIEILKREGVKLSIFWKFLVIFAPIAITILLQVLFLLLGGK